MHICKHFFITRMIVEEFYSQSLYPSIVLNCSRERDWSSAVSSTPLHSYLLSHFWFQAVIVLSMNIRLEGIWFRVRSEPSKGAQHSALKSSTPGCSDRPWDNSLICVRFSPQDLDVFASQLNHLVMNQTSSGSPFAGSPDRRNSSGGGGRLGGREFGGPRWYIPRFRIGLASLVSWIIALRKCRSDQG